MSRRRKPIALRIFSWIFDIALILALLLVAGGVYLYTQKNINCIDAYKQVQSLNNSVNVETLAPERFTQSDLDSINTKMESSTLSGKVIKYTNKEVSAYINKSYKDKTLDTKIALASGDVDLLDYGFELIQFKFVNEQQSDTKLTDINTVFKLNISKLKKDRMSQFPYSILANTIPDEVYVTTFAEIKITGDRVYSIEPKSINLNNLDEKETINMFKVLNLFANVGDATIFNTAINYSFLQALIGSNSMYSKLQTKGALDYAFESNSTTNYFDVYTVNTSTTYSITYNNTKDAVNPNVTSYTIKHNIIQLQDIETNGYNFIGWYTSPLNIGDKIETIDASTLTNYILYAKWELINYSIEYELNGGEVATPNPTTYNIESENITLNNPTKVVVSVVCEFLGWTGTGLTSITNHVVIPKGSYGNRKYTARYDGEKKDLTIIVNGTTLDTVEVTIDEEIDMNSIFNSDAYGMCGYAVNTWYSNPACTTPYDFTNKVYEDVIIYGKWSYINNHIHFYENLNWFNERVSAGSITLTSHNQLVSYIDFVRFYNITSQVKLYLPYVVGGIDDIMDEIQSAYNELTANNTPFFQNGSTFKPGAGGTIGGIYGLFYAENNSYWNSQASLVMDENKTQTYTQQDYGMKMSYPNLRNSTFNSFKINNVPNEIEVTTSDQLEWVLENGYKPNCRTNSSAEQIYNKAKQVLRTIISDSMNDIDKLRAIYEWLIINVEYDNMALAQSSVLSASILKKYDSWFAEGVFNSHVAVCEGFAKALVIMAKLEGIPAIMVTGNNHTWNKVLLNGKWYGIDATHGNTCISSSRTEILTYRQFLFTDAYKHSIGYTGDIYTNFVANTQFNYYDNVSFTFQTDEFDLQIDNADELTLLFKSAKTSTKILNNGSYVVDFSMTSAKATLFDIWLSEALLHSGISASNCSQLTVEDDSNGNRIYIIIIRTN